MDHNTQYEPQAGPRAPFCLGHPSHALRPEEVICSVCGALAAHTTLGIYEVRKLLGTGRSGHAYQAVHQRSGQPVAIKLFPAYTANPEQWEAARREVRVTTALRHSSILSVFSCSTWSLEQLDGGSGVHFERSSSGLTNLYLLTLCQYIPGALRHFVAYLQNSENQQALYEHGSSPRALMMHVLIQIGSALTAAHTRGLAHGALVPGNILFSSYDRVWVADFGLARLQPPPSPYLASELYTAAQASQQGNAQAYWNAVSPASDQYMFAALCQQLLPQTLQRQDYEPLLPILNRALHPRPERRYPSLHLLIQDMVALTSRPTHPAVSQQFKQPQIAASKHQSAPSSVSSSGVQKASSPNNSAPLTPIPTFSSGPLTPALPATPITPAIPLTPEDWEKRGDKLFTMRDYDEALKAYHRAIEVNAGKASIWLALGDTYFALERYKEALMAYEQAMHINPNDPQIWLNRGTVLDALGRHQEALDCYERADQLRSA
ncbi:protein kinase family protein [Dictyobacter formicarum]|uniref:non-specific serine/threonine protein kinase n=1 Tax=Dictyobacter formicarum TaxID=2778368 RepID=A0ABQ3V8F8_9CHLR|nr:protein kinase family protein [Dictyobacter formicarum]GHO82026.1 hypothetical protein KSZ_00320 [Dictyobacter formicarum]